MRSAKWASVDNECQRKPVSPTLISKQNRRGSTLKPLASCFECGVCGAVFFSVHMNVPPGGRMTLAEGCLVHKNVSYERLSLVIPLTYGRFRALS